MVEQEPDPDDHIALAALAAEGPRQHMCACACCLLSATGCGGCPLLAFPAWLPAVRL